MSVAQQADSVYALLADGTTVEIRPAVPADFDAVKAMYEAMSPDNIYLRFFDLNRRAAEDEAQRTCRNAGPGHVALIALADGVVVGCASYYVLGQPAQPGDSAEIAFAVADHMHHRGIATLLLEHLVSFAASHQISTFSAETLAENTAMLRVFADVGLSARRVFATGSSSGGSRCRVSTLVPHSTPTSTPWPHGNARPTRQACGTCTPPGRTGSSPWTHGSRWRPTSRRTRSCGYSDS
jgi:RimJ/RimL family protein N-acetyltransferase